MRRLSALCVTMLALPGLALGADDKAKAPEGDLAKIQGTWAAMVGPQADIPIEIEIKGKAATLRLSRNGDNIELKGELALNEKASPKTIDWMNWKSPMGDNIPVNLGIYKIDGDTMTTCSGGPGNDRPSEFKQGEAGPPNLVTYKRKKADANEKEAKDAPKGDLAGFEGAWETKVGPNKDRPMVVEFKGSSVVASITDSDGNPASYKGETVVNASAAPKAIDFVKFKGPDGAELGDNLGIYKLEGATLLLCVGGHGNPRPTEFKGGDGADGPQLWTFARKK